MARILVIDDHEELRAMLALALTSEGHEVVSAADGREGLARYRARTVDLVITDLYMPEQEGLETIKEFQQCYPEVPIIAMSGRMAAETMLSIAKKLGAVDGLQKPFLPDALIAAVNRVLKGAGEGSGSLGSLPKPATR